MILNAPAAFRNVDSSFGNNGSSPPTTPATPTVPGFHSDDYLYREAVQADGKIVVVGSVQHGDDFSGWDIAITRCNPDGALDSTFGVGGSRIVDLGGVEVPGGLALQGDRIVVSGATIGLQDAGYHAVVLRLNADGSPDTTFQGSGQLIFDLGPGTLSTVEPHVAVFGDKAFVGSVDRGTETGEDFAAVRLNRDGSLDTTFGDEACSLWTSVVRT
ncbi:MAG: delta-60 repeat domain-containing protein [Isosphaeraceae bacterium]